MNDEATYGMQFLDAWKHGSGTIGDFDYEAIQEMKAADRESFIRLIRKQCATLPYSTIQLLREASPQEAASRLHAQAEKAQRSGLTLFALFTFLGTT